MASHSGSIIRIVVILLGVVILFALITYYQKHMAKTSERFNSIQPSGSLSTDTSKTKFGAGGSGDMSKGVSSVEPITNAPMLPLPGGNGGGQSITEAFPQDRITPDELLPKNASNSDWAKANPAGQGDVKDQNFLTAGYHIGFDTQGSSRRNASHDIRSSPPNPRYRVSIWQQSTIDADLNRRPLE